MKTTILATIELEIECDVYGYDPGCQYLRNGDPGYPPSGPNVDYGDVTITSGPFKKGLLYKDAPRGLLDLLDLSSLDDEAIERSKNEDDWREDR